MDVTDAKRRLRDYRGHELEIGLALGSCRAERIAISEVEKALAAME